MIQRPKVSVVVIGYNIEKYINNCLDSLINQNYDNYEIVFVNDGSKDSTLEKAQSYAYANDLVRVIDKPNGGIVSARKEGLKNCTGDYVCFVDGDDWVENHMISSLVYGLEDESVDIVQSNFYEQRDNGDFQLREQRPEKEFLMGDEYLVSILNDELAHFMFAKLYKRQFLLSCGYLEYLEVTMAEDLMTNSLVGLYNPKVHLVDNSVYFYRYNASSCSRDGTDKLIEQVKTIKFIIRKFEEAGKYNEYKDLLDFLWFSYAVTYVTNPSVHPYVKKKILNTVKPFVLEWKNNTYSVDLWNNIGKIRKVTFNVFNYAPFFASIYTFALNKAKAINQKRHDNFFYKRSLENKIKYDNYINSITLNTNKKTIFLIGTSSRSNVGDHAIAHSEIEFLKQYFSKNYFIIEITEDCYTCEKEKLSSIVKAGDVIFVTGGGFLGDLWIYEEKIVRDIINRFRNNKIVIFPQTVYFSECSENNIEYVNSVSSYRSHEHILFCLRDKKSYELLNAILGESKCCLYPDMALLNEFSLPQRERNGALVCLRKDKERVLSKLSEKRIEELLKHHNLDISYGSTLAEGKKNGDISLERREEVLIEKLNEFRRYKLVITDRLHGMILSCLAGTPCIAFDNSSKKVSGVYNQWMKELPYVTTVASYDEFEKEFDRIINAGSFDYQKDYLCNQEEQFVNKIKTFISEE